VAAGSLVPKGTRRHTRRMRRRSQARRGLTTALLLVMVAVAGGTASAHPAAATSAMTESSLVGTWQRTTTCAQLAAALTKAGLQKFVLEFVAGNGFIPGVSRPEQIRDRANPCNGAIPRKHSHFFTKSRKFGSLDWKGRPVDDGTYGIGRGTVTIFKEFPKVTFRYRIAGNLITFSPAIAKGCSAFRCAWAISMAYPGKSWRRVR
jgi:hypothetical protein